MTVSNEQRVSEEAVAKLLRATRANDAETAPKRHPRQTDQCPNIARFAAVLRPNSDGTPQAAWTQEEARHTRNCAFCQSMFELFRVAKAAGLPAVDAGEETVTNLDTSQETQTGLTASETKKGASSSKSETTKTGSPPKPPAGG